MRGAEHFEGFVTAEEARAKRYQYVPITIPAGCTRLDVSYHFHCPGNEGGVAVDIGVFDTRGTEPFTGGFRGWSGSARRSFTIGRDYATPGYVHGPLTPGTWSIVIGLAEIAEPGIQWFVSAETEWEERDGPREASISSPRIAATREPLAGGDVLQWYRGDLHTHTEHSDGDNSIAEMAAEGSRLGLDFLAITDHNTVSHHAEIDAGDWPLLLLPGEEVTMYWGHCNAWG
ncbi:MAG TPA: PHP domain-containing protein, partial [Tepidiformaceae bacterium]|nr:PHP domain-containing protein [Tepidiformaceae bacterium]